MAPPPSPNSAALMDELVEDCLLRLPPEDPADLARAALVSKQWHRVVTGATFRRRYIEFHRRSAPLLGYYMLNLDNDSTRFVPTSSFRPPQADRRDRLRAIHSRHGRVLLHSGRPGSGSTQGMAASSCDRLRAIHSRHPPLGVGSQKKDKQWELPVLQADAWIENGCWNAALVCAGGDGCTHLDCHFKVVVLLRCSEWWLACFYFSSEAVSWSGAIFVSEDAGFSSNYCSKPDTVFAGNAFYFKTGNIIFKLDLQTHRMCRTWCRGLPATSSPLFATEDGSNLLFATEDGNTVGLAKITNNSTLCVWLRKQGTWVESRRIQLRGLLPDDALCDPLLPPQTYIDKPSLVGFSETGAGVIFLRTCVGYFTIDLNSGRSKMIGNDVLGSGHIVPYVSFCTPAPGKDSTDLGTAASVVVSTVDEPGAGVKDLGFGLNQPNFGEIHPFWLGPR